MDKSLEYPQLSHCPVAWQAKLTPNAIAIENNKQRISFSELHEQVSSISQQLISLSIKQADRLAFGHTRWHAIR